MRRFYKSISLGLTCITSSLVFANGAALTTCPLVNSFKNPELEVSIPYHYNADTKTMDTLVVASYPADANQTFDFLIHPVQGSTDGERIQNINMLMTQLQPTSETPLTTHLNDEDGDISVCTYHIPGGTSITALLVANDDDINNTTYTSEQDMPHLEEHRAYARRLLGK